MTASSSGAQSVSGTPGPPLLRAARVLGHPRILRWALQLFGAIVIALGTHAALEFFGSLQMVDDSAYESHQHESVLPALINCFLMLFAIIVRMAVMGAAAQQKRDPLEYFAQSQRGQPAALNFCLHVLTGFGVLYAMEAFEHVHAFGHLPDSAEVLGGSLYSGGLTILGISALYYGIRSACIRLCIRAAVQTVLVVCTWIVRLTQLAAELSSPAVGNAARRYAAVQRARLHLGTRAAGRRGPPCNDALHPIFNS